MLYLPLRKSGLTEAVINISNHFIIVLEALSSVNRSPLALLPSTNTAIIISKDILW